MKRTYILLITISSILLSCSKEEPAGKYNNGRIEYKITYLNGEDGGFDPSFLPKKMVLEFNKEFCTNSIDGFMGLFRLANITYFGKKRSITHLKVLEKNYLFEGGRHELMCCFDVFEDMVITEDTTTKTIAGLASNHAIAFIPGYNETFDIYYTDEIRLAHPNITNPYLDIKGVLTDFVLYMGPYKMRFVANKFDPARNPKDDIIATEEALMVSRDEMVYALDRLMRQ